MRGGSLPKQFAKALKSSSLPAAMGQ